MDLAFPHTTIAASLLVAIMTSLPFFNSNSISRAALERRGLVVRRTVPKKLRWVNGIVAVSAMQAAVWLFLTLSSLQTIKWIEEHDWTLLGVSLSGRLLVTLAFTLFFGVVGGFYGVVCVKNRCGLYFWQRHVVRRGTEQTEQGSGVND